MQAYDRRPGSPTSDYEDVAAQQVWDTVRIDLPPLRAVIAQELAGGGCASN